MLKQEKGYGCGLYAVANALNLDGFVTEERLESSKNGVSTRMLSKWLEEDGHNFYIGELYYNLLGKRMPDSAMHYIPIKTGIVFPVMINVRRSKEGRNHLVGGRINVEGDLYLYDRLEKEVIKTTMRKVNKRYPYVFGLFCFLSFDCSKFITYEV